MYFYVLHFHHFHTVLKIRPFYTWLKKIVNSPLYKNVTYMSPGLAHLGDLGYFDRMHQFTEGSHKQLEILYNQNGLKPDSH